MLHSAGDEPEHKMHLCQSSLSRGRSAHNMQLFWHKIPGSISHTQYHICRNFELNSLKETRKSGGGHIFWILFFCCGWNWSCAFNTYLALLFFVIWRDRHQWTRATPFTRFLDHTHRRTTVGRNPLDGWSARRRDLYLTTHNTHNRQNPCGIRTHDISRRATADLRLKPCGHRNRLLCIYFLYHKYN